MGIPPIPALCSACLADLSFVISRAKYSFIKEVKSYVDGGAVLCVI